MLDRNKLKFPTRVQKINELLMRKVQRMKFMKELTEYWDSAGSPLVKIPTIGGNELNLHLLHSIVTRLGGYERVCAERCAPLASAPRRGGPPPTRPRLRVAAGGWR